MHIFARVTLETVDPTSRISYPVVPNAFNSDSNTSAQVEEEASAGIIRLSSYNLKNEAVNSIKEVQVVYHDPFTEELYEYHVDYDALPPSGKINPLQKNLNAFLRKENTYERVENEQQAEIMGVAKLYDIISSQVQGSMSMEGSPSLVAGTTFLVEGIGKLSGKYAITGSMHKINRSSGYTTEVDVKMVTL